VIMTGLVKGGEWRESGSRKAATRHHVGYQVYAGAVSGIKSPPARLG